ncbi:MULTISPECIES: Hachiman antiphage defense system protein HamA [Enterococcus]|uniref:Hachiman antiphage defense system protein HamA n=3 Tax=Enterococcus TaxID=1350 RepID=UPI002649D12C|nr:Hachiman antiphage defense system protein HamA [Enterococcus entomosocium]
MQVLLHYTTNQRVFNYFDTHPHPIFEHKQLAEVKNFHKKYSKFQEHLFFIVCYSSSNKQVHYSVGKISKNASSEFFFSKVNEEIQSIILYDLGLVKTNTYEKHIYYKENTLTCNDHFISKNIGELLNKIKLRYFCWEEIISSKVTLFQKLNDILFDQTIVLDIASSYNPSIHKYEERLLKKKYYSALQSIGFISKHELDTDLSVLHGDIGEFLMHHLVSNYISDNNSVKYLYPKLVLKSNPKMPAYGNDGTIYVPSKKEIFYLEAKFYTNLTKAINKAVDSLKEHNEVTQENIDHKTELFRNIKTKSNDEIIEITDDVNEKLVLFLICDNIFKEEDVLKCLKKNNGLIELKKSFEVIIFVLPILSKSEFLESFKKQSILRGNQYYVQ